jgi:hypothetical protein
VLVAALKDARERSAFWSVNHGFDDSILRALGLLDSRAASPVNAAANQRGDAGEASETGTPEAGAFRDIGFL